MERYLACFCWQWQLDGLDVYPTLCHDFWAEALVVLAYAYRICDCMDEIEQHLLLFQQL